MSGQGISQIVVYAVALIVLGYPLGIWMAHVYTAPQPAGRFFDSIEAGFLRLVRAHREREQDWKSYGKAVLVFSILFAALLYVIQRLQGVLPLNPQQKALQCCLIPFRFDKYALAVVDDPALEAHLSRQTIDKRAKPHALHGAADYDSNTL